MAKIKSTKNSTKESISLKNPTWHDFLSEDSFRFFPEKDDWRKRLIFDLLSWVELDNSLFLMQFLLLKKIHRDTFYDWCKKFSDLNKAYEYVKLIIATRKLNGALKKEFDKDVVFKDMHRLDPEYLEINKYWSDQKKQEDADKDKKYILIDRILSEKE